MSLPATKPIEWSRKELALRACAFGSVLVLAAAVIWFSISDFSGGPVIASGADLRVPVKMLKKGKILLFNYAIDDQTLTQVALQRGEDDVLRASFTACRACRTYRHYMLFGKLICGHCGHSIVLPKPSDFPNPAADCAPIALPYFVEGNELVVNGKSVLEIFDHWYRQRPRKRVNGSNEESGPRPGPSTK